MNALQNFIFENHTLLFKLSIVWAVLGFGILLWIRRRRGMVLPKVNDPDIIFVERFASGASQKSWLTRSGGASNCLTVIVTKTHLTLTTFFPFTAIAGFYDLEHHVPLENISEITIEDSVTYITFKRDDELICKMKLWLRNNEALLQALNGE